MKVGYARVSTKDQNLDLQIDALKEAGCQAIYKEKASGKDLEREELKKLLGKLQPGDIVTVYKLDRLGRSLKDLVEQVNKFKELQVAFVSLKENIDTSTATGGLIFHLFAALAQFERELIVERTHAGLKAARLRGKKGGRPAGLSKGAWSKALMVNQLYNMRVKSMPEIAKDLDISESSAFRYNKAVKAYLAKAAGKKGAGTQADQDPAAA